MEEEPVIKSKEFYAAQKVQRDKILEVEKNTNYLIENLKGEIEKNGVSAEMNAVVGRIPLLCQSVLNIHEVLQELKDGQTTMNDKLDNNFVAKDGQYWVVKALVFGFATLILIGFVSALIYLVFKVHIN